jgi:3-dehydroquinate dehydratase
MILTNNLLLKLNKPITLDTFQSNWEGAIVDRIHQAQTEGVKFIIINPAASPILQLLYAMPYLALPSIY